MTFSNFPTGVEPLGKFFTCNYPYNLSLLLLSFTLLRHSNPKRNDEQATGSNQGFIRRKSCFHWRRLVLPDFRLRQRLVVYRPPGHCADFKNFHSNLQQKKRRSYSRLFAGNDRSRVTDIIFQPFSANSHSRHAFTKFLSLTKFSAHYQIQR